MLHYLYIVRKLRSVLGCTLNRPCVVAELCSLYVCDVRSIATFHAVIFITFSGHIFMYCLLVSVCKVLNGPYCLP